MGCHFDRVRSDYSYLLENPLNCKSIEKIQTASEAIYTKKEKKPDASISDNRVAVQKAVQLTKYVWDMTKYKVNYFFPPRYLIVEDNFIGRSDLGKILREYNHKHFVDIAETGPEALERFKKLLSQGFQYDCIFMDIDIPDIKGNIATQMIREYERPFSVHTKIAAVTVNLCGIEEESKDIFDEFCN